MPEANMTAWVRHFMTKPRVRENLFSKVGPFGCVGKGVENNRFRVAEQQRQESSGGDGRNSLAPHHGFAANRVMADPVWRSN